MYFLEEPGKIQLRLVNMFSNQVTIVEAENEKVEVDYQISLNTSFLPSGVYSLQAIFNENIILHTNLIGLEIAQAIFGVLLFPMG